MFEDEKIKLIQSLPEGDALVIVWIKLICLAGKCNANGYFFISESIPYTDEMLSITLNKPLPIIRLALKTLQNFEMLKKDENGHYFINNFTKHQNISGLEKIREQGKIRTAKYREKNKLLLKQGESENCNVTVTQCNATDIDIDIEKENIIKEFENFWNLYDKKRGNKDKIFKKWLKLSDKEKELIFKYIPEYKNSQPDKQFRKDPETFLNNKSWNDELIYSDKTKEPETKKSSRLDVENYAIELLEKNKNYLIKKLQINGEFDSCGEADRILKKDPDAIIKRKKYPVIYDALIRQIEKLKIK